MQITRSPDHPITRFVLAPLLFLIGSLSPEIQGLLDRVVKLYGDGASHAAAFTQTYTPAGFSAARSESGTVWIQTPQRLRFEYAAPEKKVFTYDGIEGRLFTPADKQLTTRRLSAEDRARLPIVFLTDPGELDRQYSIQRETAGGGAARLLLKPRTQRPDLAWLRVTIADDGSIGGLSYEDSSGNRSEFRFETWRKDKPRPASDYKVTGPPGTRVLEN
ncbi:MAG TPA: outer membrane lipoprotein carrier protein LolA [Thermoanaerobaculia bacterium]|nr:outer membrane lipoprotein carrier protein LolA [Thermoanaerobaculia bacterium]